MRGGGEKKRGRRRFLLNPERRKRKRKHVMNEIICEINSVLISLLVSNSYIFTLDVVDPLINIYMNNLYRRCLSHTLNNQPLSILLRFSFAFFTS